MNCCSIFQAGQADVRHNDSEEPYTPPVWIIDLSLAPRDRYRKIARHYQELMRDLTCLFDDLLLDIGVPNRRIPTINKISPLLLRKLYDSTQTEELRGISEESGVAMYLLVAFNVILDLLMGCTSGGVRTLEKGQSLSQAKMLHFRTLDWSMDRLRLVVVQLDFIRSKSSTPKKVLASSITYVGFVGVLTGVRQNLSMSLNFRGLHDTSSKYTQFRFYFHHLLVFFGRRPSIATYLRQFLTGDHDAMELGARRWTPSSMSGALEMTSKSPMRLADIYTELNSKHTTACYLIFCDGDMTISIDKDFFNSTMRESKDFIATTNHDVANVDRDSQTTHGPAAIVQQSVRHKPGLNDFFEESEGRLKCISDRWKKTVTREKRRQAESGQAVQVEDTARQTSIPKKRVIEWVSKYPTTNESTHFATVMDPREGKIVWSLVYPEPLEDS